MARRGGLRQGPGVADFLNYLYVELHNLVALTAMGLNFEELKSVGLHEKQAVATSKLGTISALT
jgi:hypothetical protein